MHWERFGGPGGCGPRPLHTQPPGEERQGGHLQLRGRTGGAEARAAGARAGLRLPSQQHLGCSKPRFTNRSIRVSRFFVHLISFFLPGPALSCQNGWSRYENKCYKVFLDKIPFFNANAKCEEHDGSLAKSSNYEVNNFLKGLIPTNNNVWLGAKLENASWNWLDGSNISQFHWDNIQPNGNGQDCLFLTTDGKWHDWYCDNTFHIQGYLCMKSGIL